MQYTFDYTWSAIDLNVLYRIEKENNLHQENGFPFTNYYYIGTFIQLISNQFDWFMTINQLTLTNYHFTQNVQFEMANVLCQICHQLKHNGTSYSSDYLILSFGLFVCVWQKKKQCVTHHSEAFSIKCTTLPSTQVCLHCLRVMSMTLFWEDGFAVALIRLGIII